MSWTDQDARAFMLEALEGMPTGLLREALEGFGVDPDDYPGDRMKAKALRVRLARVVAGLDRLDGGDA